MPHGHGLTDFLYQRDGAIIAFARPDLAVAGSVVVCGAGGRYRQYRFVERLHLKTQATF
jgi:hypothetical protein